MAAKSVAPLQIPAGLEPPDTGSALKIPALNDAGAAAAQEADPLPRRAAARSSPPKSLSRRRSIMRCPPGRSRAEDTSEGSAPKH